MRPLTLEIEGFTAFKQRTVIDFSDLDLFAITGPTGSGKSSIIDSICYALYGRTPRVTDKVAACISPNMDRMAVTMEFLADGTKYRVFRETRRKGQGNTRFEVMDLQTGEWNPKAERAGEVTKEVQKVIGLDFNAFTRSVLLPQGEFQQFLAGSPDERRSVLDKLLRIEVYRRMGQRANQEAATVLAEIQQMERRLNEELRDATPEALEARRQELDATVASLKHIDAAVSALQQAVDAARALSEVRTQVQRQEAAVRQASSKLAATEAAAGGESQVGRLEAALKQVQDKLAANSYDDTLFDDLVNAANLAIEVDKVQRAARDLATQIASQEKVVAATAKALEAARQTETEAAKRRLEAEARLEEAQRHDLAASLQSSLKPGDPCPVCGGVVGELPALSTDNLDNARRTLEAARAEADEARSAATAAGTKAAIAENNLANLKKQSAEQQKQLEPSQRALDAALPGFPDKSPATLKALLDAQRQARTEREDLRKQEQTIEAQIKGEEERARAAEAELLKAKAELAVAEAGLAQIQEQAEAAGAKLVAIVEKHDWPEIRAEIESGHDAQPRLEAEHRAAFAQQKELLLTQGRLENDIARIERDIETAAKLRVDVAERKSQYDVAADLGDMLKVNRFPAYVQSEALRTLAQGGSRRLLDLSSGRYELQVEEKGQNFEVIDHWNVDDVRSVNTLSGGETFLASLALALALAETLPGIAPGHRLTLDSIFLDEGFGSLDPEALDRAADALDALRAEERMVCVITHLRELADRMPAQINVHKAEEGSTISVL